MYAGIVTPSLNLLQSFGCDGIDRLPASSEAGSWTRHYGYDQYGNGWVTANSGVPPSASTPQAASNYNPQNQLLIDGAAYDAAGNQTAIAGLLHTHDAENRLLTSTLGGVTTAYTYDGDGRRVMKSSVSGATVYVYDAAGQLAAEYGAVTTPPPCATCYLTADHLGSTRMVTDSNGTVQSLTDYLPFGEEIQSGVGGRPAPYYPSDALAVADGVTQKFTGKERDVESGNDYFGARYFSGAEGRFTTADWSGAPRAIPYASLGDPQSLSLYGYVRNNPLTRRDYDGHVDCSGKNADGIGCQLIASWKAAAGPPPAPAPPPPPKAPPLTATGGIAQRPQPLAPQAAPGQRPAVTTGVGIGITTGATATAGLGIVGAAASGGATAAGFANSRDGVTGGVSASGGLMATAGSHAVGLPSQPSDSTAFGAFAGVGAGITLTNAGTNQSLATMTTVWSFDVGLEFGGSIQVAAGPQGIAAISVTVGPAIGLAFTKMDTATAASGDK